MKQQGFTEWEILETYEDGWLAGDREIQLQKEYGYPVDKIHYMISIQNTSNNIPIGFTKEQQSKGGRKSGRQNVESGHLENIRDQQKAGKASGIKKKINGDLAKMQNLAQIARSKKVTCPHCNKEGAKFNMTRYHFDNCKHRETNLSK
jgi:hypothetical protein